MGSQVHEPSATKKIFSDAHEMLAVTFLSTGLIRWL